MQQPLTKPTKTKSKHPEYRQTPCANCGRFGCIPGAMKCDVLKNTFCSQECCYSFYLRSYQHKTSSAVVIAAKQTAMRRHNSTNERVSKSTSEEVIRSEEMQPQPNRPARRKPPRFPYRGQSPRKRSAEVSLDSRHAMLDFHDSLNWL